MSFEVHPRGRRPTPLVVGIVVRGRWFNQVSNIRKGTFTGCWAVLGAPGLIGGGSGVGRTALQIAFHYLN